MEHKMLYEVGFFGRGCRDVIHGETVNEEERLLLFEYRVIRETRTSFQVAVQTIDGEKEMKLYKKQAGNRLFSTKPEALRHALQLSREYIERLEKYLNYERGHLDQIVSLAKEQGVELR